jgi:hypothetical protein
MRWFQVRSNLMKFNWHVIIQLLSSLFIGDEYLFLLLTSHNSWIFMRIIVTIALLTWISLTSSLFEEPLESIYLLSLNFFFLSEFLFLFLFSPSFPSWTLTCWREAFLWIGRRILRVWVFIVFLLWAYFHKGVTSTPKKANNYKTDNWFDAHHYILLIN